MDEYKILIKVPWLGHFMMKSQFGDFSSKKFIALVDIFTLYAFFLLLESIVRRIKLLKGEES